VNLISIDQVAISPIPIFFISSCVMLYISEEGTACVILHLLCSFVRCAIESCQRLETYFCYYIIQTMDIVYLYGLQTYML